MGQVLNLWELSSLAMNLDPVKVIDAALVLARTALHWFNGQGIECRRVLLITE
ncbi:hypothetical protein KBZ18_12805 [Synechococcus sp. Cruz-9H2]|uniref:hypothetical protein n=1 Tax=unclassified Synechococcus TaxID=2626047 RepID=UPI0020CDCD84|nr:MULTISPECIES: hypothetical protein [unclassified Synechococcus]MCP9820364.1 hypothetical protein [Synechococcus sp. Cruz-9H2]MCP9844672.1 hypothetical protein [Synechococcus sp. Edmonson 11F2]MCP9856794.1 hypothetical protein [Synechococcus sp. Cruz-9C9]MCP9863996.1 hypothetical protein [Synechococcus sp. Cruz-7E5]MCP9871191.1 hypothetical protein [Synechococcus sp. Cruz-7B9]